MNGTKAAIAAGYAPKSARVTASQLLAKPNIEAAVEAACHARQARTQVTADAVVQQLARIAFGSAVTALSVRALELLGKHLGVFDGRGLPVADVPCFALPADGPQVISVH